MSIEYGIRSSEFIKGEVSQLDIMQSVELGTNLGDALKAGRVGIGYADDSKSKANAMAVMAALSSKNINVWSFGASFLAKLSYLTCFSCLNAGIFIDSKRGAIILVGPDGVSVSESLKNKISENIEHEKSDKNEYSNIFDMKSLNGLYSKALQRELYGEDGFNCVIKSSNPQIEMLLNDVLKNKENEKLVLRVNKFGTGVSAYTKQTGLVPYSRLQLICESWEKSHCGVFLSNKDSEYLKIAYKNDGLFTAVRLLRILKYEDLNFESINEAVPENYVKRRVLNIEMNKDLYKNLKNNGYDIKYDKENIFQLNTGTAVASILPLDGGKTGVLSQSSSIKGARSLDEEIEKILEKQCF